MRATFAAAVMAALLLSAPVHADTVTWKYDDWQGTIEENADGKNKHPHKAYPGFVAGEAYGQLYKPKASDYPIKILNVQMVVASPNVTPPGQANISIEIWNDTSDTAQPNISKPTFSINSSEFFSGSGASGVPLKGNTAMIYKFDPKDPKGAPPTITKGNIRLMIRFTSKAVDGQKWWNELGCAKIEITGVTLGCGCQKVAPLTDSSTTKKANLMHIITPLGMCTGSKKWMWIEDVAKEGKAMSGDFILRMLVDTAGGPLVIDAGPTDAGGPDAGSDSTPPPQDTGGKVDAGPPPMKNPVVELVTPKEIEEGKITAIQIVGKYFETNATVKVGKYKAQVSKVMANKIEANVLSDVPAGVYALIVENPSGGIGFKDDALTVIAKVEEDAGAPPDTGPEDTGPDVVAPAAKPVIELVTPDHGPGDKEMEITIVGQNFEDGATVKIGSAKQLVVSVKPTSIVAKVLAPMVPGVYTVLVENLSGQVGFKEKAYTVDEPPEVDVPPVDAGTQDTGTPLVPAQNPPADSGCSTAPTGHGAAGMLMLLAMLGLVALRRREA